MNKKKLAALVASLLMSSPLYAGKTFISPQWGQGDLSMDSSLTATEDAGDSAVFRINVGHKFDSNLMVGGTYGLSDNASWLLFNATDSYTIVDYGAVLGYSIEVAEHFRIVPMVAYTRWNFEGREGMLFNPGDEEEVELDGWDPYYQLNLAFPLSRRFGLNLAWSYGDYEYGEMTSTTFGLNFEF